MERLFKKLKDFNQNELEEYVKKLKEDTSNDGPIIDEMDKKINQMLNSGQMPVYQLIHFETYEDPRLVYSDHYVPLADCLKGAYLTRCKQGSEFTSEMMIPVPTTIDIKTTDFLTPFPFIVEMPTLNPTLKVKDILVDILDEAGKADSNKLKVT